MNLQRRFWTLASVFMPKRANAVFEEAAFPQSTNVGREAARGKLEIVFEVL